ncbi:SWIM zinc finger family protein [Streptomyces sp. NPDC047085]|uniref:SWIM zinc finger family protein n=1 Tax=Streptomyces sp. NPDC047085 TaxID=3155140 RepID=UPI0033C734DE
MTTGDQRPGDAARRALRAARERAASAAEATADTPAVSREHADAAGSTEEAAHRPASADPEPGPEPGPGEVAREALRAAVAARSARRDAMDVDAPKAVDASKDIDGSRDADASTSEGVGSGVAHGRREDADASKTARAVAGREGERVLGLGSGRGSAAPGRAGASPAGDPADGPPHSERHASTADSTPADAAHSPTAAPGHSRRPDAPSGEAAPAGGRPADVAREALRAARRQALRDAEATKPGDRRPRRTPPRPASAASREEPSTARSQAAHDMRQFLATAFRMPSWTDTPEAPGDTHSADDATDRTDLHPPAPEREVSHAPSAPTPPPPPLPATMATPHRDTELRRTFPAFAPRAASTEDLSFAETWWGNAWVDALEQGALDVKRLGRGRGYAEQGNVDAITVTPGLVLAYVRGSRPRPYRVQVRLRTLEDADWERFLDAAADRPGHIAALLDKELPQSLADCGVPLLPGPGDLAPRCSCPDSGHPCKHAAALCYQTARLLDADPFVLLLLRGRGERQLLDALSRRSAARAARAAQERQPGALPGVRAAEALAADRRLPQLPPPLPMPAHPEQPPVYPAAPGGPDPFALDQLATDAAARAHALLTTGRDPVGELTLWQDAVRLAAARPGSGLTAATRALYATLAAATGRGPADLARAVAAWRQGGLAGLTVLEEPWDPPAGRFDRARPLLLAADLPAFRPWRNHLTHPRGHVQLRLGRDGLWYAYESEPGRSDWWPRGTPDLDPVGALTGLDTPDDL